jgi:hypothetical protein
MGPNSCSRPTPAALFAIGSPLRVKVERPQSIDRTRLSEESGNAKAQKVGNFSQVRVISRNYAYARYVNGIQYRASFRSRTSADISLFASPLLPYNAGIFLSSTMLARWSLRNFAHRRDGRLFVSRSEGDSFSFLPYDLSAECFRSIVGETLVRVVHWADWVDRAEKRVHPLPLIKCARLRPNPRTCA